MSQTSRTHHTPIIHRRRAMNTADNMTDSPTSSATLFPWSGSSSNRATKQLEKNKTTLPLAQLTALAAAASPSSTYKLEMENSYESSHGAAVAADENSANSFAPHNDQLSRSLPTRPRKRTTGTSSEQSLQETSAMAATAALAAVGTATGNNTSTSNSGNNRVKFRFPWKLHAMLEYCASPSQPDLSHIMTWNEAGTAFAVLDTQLFASTVLPIFFAHGKYASFQRQLNLYGFERVRGPAPWATSTLTDSSMCHCSAIVESMIQGPHNSCSTQRDPTVAATATISYYRHPSFVRHHKEWAIRVVRCKKLSKRQRLCDIEALSLSPSLSPCAAATPLLTMNPSISPIELCTCPDGGWSNTMGGSGGDRVGRGVVVDTTLAAASPAATTLPSDGDIVLFEGQHPFCYLAYDASHQSKVPFSS